MNITIVHMWLMQNIDCSSWDRTVWTTVIGDNIGMQTPWFVYNGTF